MSSSMGSLQELARGLEVVASDVRLQILQQLREPTRVSAIRVTAGLSREGERPERPLSRQTITHHLDQLLDAGLVKPSAVGGDKRGGAYVVNHERLFALVDELRQLNRLRPYEDLVVDPSATMAANELQHPPPPPRPRLVEAYGAQDGRAFQVAGKGPVVMGRSRESDLHLDHDPYVSSNHCELGHDGEHWTITDLDSSNGTWLNWNRVSPGKAHQVRAGDLLRVGRTVLVFQP